MQTILEFFIEKVNKYTDNVFLWEKPTNKFIPTTYGEAFEKVKALTCGLNKFGLNPFDKVGLLSEGCNLWLISELSVLSNRAITVPMSIKLEPDNDLIFRLQHSECKFVIVSASQLYKLRLLKDKLPLLEKIIVLQPDTELEEGEINISDIIKTGEEVLRKNPDLYKDLYTTIQPNDVATITYTSGTTAQPKGIMLTHNNYTSNVKQAFSFMDIPSHYSTLAVLPWDHAFAHTAALYAFMMKGASIASVQVGKTQMETLKNFTTNIKEIKPYVLMSVPAIAKNFKKNIVKGIEKKGKNAINLFNFALKVAFWYNGKGYNKGRGIKFIAKPLLLIFNKLLFNKIKEGFGGNLKFFIGGGALLDYDLQQFFYAIGIPMYQGYGLSEASPIISANSPDFHKLGSSGKVLNGIKIKICDEKGNDVGTNASGEIVIKGDNVMKGYWKNEEATSETIVDDWLFTGDLGYIDDENYLYVHGRFKSLLISSDGEKYSPEGIEEAIMDSCPIIDKIMLYNNQSTYTSAVIVPNVDMVNKILSNDSSKDWADIINIIQEQLAIFKTGGKNQSMFPQRWLPTTFTIAHEQFTEHNKLINSTMKIVRNKIVDFFDEDIKFCYNPEGKNPNNIKNIKNLQKICDK